MKRVIMLSVLLLIISVILVAQEKVQVKSGVKSQNSEIIIGDTQIPVVIIDGKKYDSDIIRLIDVDLIAAVDILKGEEAERLFNEKAVIVITTKEKVREKQDIKVRIKVPDDETAEKPVVVIDGKVAEKGELDLISPDQIESITVLKDEISKKKYNSGAGVILIVTKK